MGESIGIHTTCHPVQPLNKKKKATPKGSLYNVSHDTNVDQEVSDCPHRPLNPDV